jgi:protein-L-isoaspartate(D-aspartate) O-methyltransferase
MIKKLQQQLLDQSKFLQNDNAYHTAMKDAFLKVERHLFVSRFKDPPAIDWTIVTPENLAELLPVLYANKPLTLYDEPDNEFKSTISQPAAVLKMLDWLELKPGNTVFEIGAASGWNAALMAELVGEGGHIYSAEIIPEMAANAKATIGRLGISNVSILQSDGAFGYEEQAPFDRIIFTAGSYDLSSCFYHQLKADGILLMVLKLPGGGNLTIQLKKVNDHFESIKSFDSEFVKMTGQSNMPSLQTISLEQLPEWTRLKDQESSRSSFWWGSSIIPLYWRTSGFRSFLGVTEPGVRFFNEVNTAAIATDGCFGILDKKNDSLTIAKDKFLITYGGEQSRITFMNALHSWVDLGMPSASNFQLAIYPIDKKLEPSGRHWLADRTDSRLLWSI